MAKVSTPRLSSGARMKAAGKVPVQLWLSEQERELIRRAAEASRRPMTQFVILHALAAAEKIQKKSRNAIDGL